MNKIFTKIATACAGLAMAIGVGVAIGNNANVVPAKAADVSDTLNRATTGQTGSPYGNWSGKTGDSGAVYAGNSAGGNSSIQLRSSGGSGIWTTTSGGVIKSITVTWNSNTASGRTLNVYGSDSAYSSLPSATPVGSIVYGTSTTYEFETEYTYVAVKSNSNALYLTDITFVWSQGGGGDTTYSIRYNPNSGSDAVTGMPSNSTGLEAGEYNLDSEATPTREGYRFVGWGENENSTTPITKVTITNGNKDVYAIWEKIVVPLPASGTIEIVGDDLSGTYGTDVLYTLSVGNDGAVFEFKCTDVMKNSGIQFKKNSGVLYNSTALSYIQSISIEGASGLTIKYGTSENNCTSDSVGTTNTHFTISNNTGGAIKPSKITISYGPSLTLNSISASLSSEVAEKTWYANDVLNASDVDVTTSYSDSSHNGTITNGTGVYFDSNFSQNSVTLTQGTNNLTVYYRDANGRNAHTDLVIANVLAPKTVKAWSVTGDMNGTVKGTAFDLSVLTLHAWYDLGKTDEATSAVAGNYVMVANPAVAGNTSNANNTIDIEIYLASDSGHSNLLATIEDYLAPIIDYPAGTINNPYTVAAARAHANSLTQTDTVLSYVVGVVSGVSDESFNSNFGNKTFWITDDISNSSGNELEMYRAYYTDADTKMTEAQFNSIGVGDRVVMCGYLKNYKGTLEMDAKCYVHSHTQETRAISLSVSSETLTIGSQFSYGGAVTTAFTVRENSDVTTEVTYSGYDMSVVGEQTVTVTYNDSAYGELTSTYTLTVAYATVSSVTINGQSNISMAQDSEHVFTASLNEHTDPNSSITWNVTNGQGSNFVNNEDYIMDNGTLTVSTTKVGTLIVTASCGGITSSPVTVTVTGNPVPTLDLDALNGIVGKQGALSSTVSGGTAPYTYSWSITGSSGVASIDGEYGSTESDVLVNFNSRGNATITLTVTDSNNKQGTVAATINVIPAINNITGKSAKTATWTSAQSIAEYPGNSANVPVDVDIDAYIHMEGAKASGNADFRFWSDGIRAYAGNSVTFTPSNGAVIKTITLPTVGGTCSDGEATKTGNVWTIKNGSSAITFSSLSKGTINTDIVVTYEINAGNIANTNYNAQKAAIEFAEDLTAKLNAVCDAANGNTDLEALDAKWTLIKGTYTTKRSALSTDDRMIFDSIIANATADKDGDALQKALSSYNYVVGKYKASLTEGDFLVETGKAAVSNASFMPFGTVTNGADNEMITVIVVMSVLATICAGGFFFYRRRKEQQ